MTGGENDTIWWADTNFRMVIYPESFPIGHQIDILVSINHSYQFNVPKGYKLVSRTYQIIASEKLQHPVTLTVEHNAVATSKELVKSLAIIHLNDNDKVDILRGYTEQNSTSITFDMNELCYVAIIGCDNIKQKYSLSFYHQKITGNRSDPYLKVYILVSPKFKTNEVCYQIFIFNIIITLICRKGKSIS